MTKRSLRKVLGAGLAGLLILNLLMLAGRAMAPRVPADMLEQDGQLVLTTADADGDGPLPGGIPREAATLVVDAADGLTPDQIRELGRDYGLDLHYNSIYSAESCLTVAHLDESRISEMIDRLEADPRVESVSPNWYYEITDQPSPASFPDDPRYNEQWHMDQIHAVKAWKWSTGRRVVVSVIDTGVAYRDFGDRFHQVEDLENTGFVTGYDFVNNRPEAVDDHCHGTHVAGTIAQSTNNGKGVAGVAWGASIMPVKVLSARGGGTLADVADGIRFSADHGATVINMSLGGPFPDATMGAAVRHAHAKGSIVVCAAGNSSSGRSGYPAGYPEAVSVSAVNMAEELTFYTNYGPSIDIAAPGGDTRNNPKGGVLQNTIAVGNPQKSDYYFFQGTSMASPHAAGVAALVASAGVTNPDAILKVMQSTAKFMGDDAKERGYGAGLIDAEAAAFRAAVTYNAWTLAVALVILALVVV
ncbi:MAG: peptidase S8, partial [Candidatus Eremiobacteraeota bacterium]|nr:peptidase S8 [Candidatus Eremiobacteraeota bacterium]